jgi:Zn ribbon nucleic-acid-binding protein
MMLWNLEVICKLRVLAVWREDDLTEVACVKIDIW